MDQKTLNFLEEIMEYQLKYESQTKFTLQLIRDYKELQRENEHLKNRIKGLEKYHD